MSILLGLEGPDANENTTRGLMDWIRQEKIPGVRVQAASEVPAEGRMGGDLANILEIVLTSSAVVGFVECIKLYIEQRRPDVKFHIKSKTKERTTEAILDAKNPGNVADVIDKIGKMAK